MAWLDVYIDVYIDDIWIYSKALNKHIEQVHNIASATTWVKCNGRKCEFHNSTPEFLGYIISCQWMEMDESKVQAVNESPTPSA